MSGPGSSLTSVGRNELLTQAAAHLSGRRTAEDTPAQSSRGPALLRAAGAAACSRWGETVSEGRRHKMVWHLQGGGGSWFGRGGPRWGGVG